jgi:uncharacterized membrane protein YphA (DoxX/SURF4 family)
LYEDSQLRLWRWFAFLFQSDQPVAVHAWFTAWVLSTLALLVGYRTRWAAPVVWLITNCCLARNPNLINGGDDVLCIALLVLMLCPSGAAWSIDAWQRRRRARAAGDSANARDGWLPAWPVRLLQLQLGTIYLSTGLHKLLGESWRDGVALHYVLHDFTTARWGFSSLPLPNWFTHAATYGTLAFELSFVLLVAFRPTRRWALWSGVLFHLGIYALMEVGWFSFYTLTLYTTWVEPEAWRRWSRRWLVPAWRLTRLTDRSKLSGLARN